MTYIKKKKGSEKLTRSPKAEKKDKATYVTLKRCSRTKSRPESTLRTKEDLHDFRSTIKSYKMQQLFIM